VNLSYILYTSLLLHKYAKYLFDLKKIIVSVTFCYMEIFIRNPVT